MLPLPLAAGLYGVLLGLGFTTFILTFAVWALAGVSVALGDPALGLLAGLGFGAGRALPVIVLAPLAGTRAGARAHAAMAERPGILRALRAADAVALAACAAVLWAAPAHAAATVFATQATDPSVDAGLLAFQQPGAGGVLVSGAGRAAAPGAHPAVGGGRLAWLRDGAIEVRAPADPAFAITIPAAGADAVAVTTGWVVWRVSDGNGDVVMASPLPPAAPEARRLVSVNNPVQLGRPALAGDNVLFHVAGRHSSRIKAVSLTTGERNTLRRQRRMQFLNPSALGDRLLYVRAGYERQQLRIGCCAPVAAPRPPALRHGPDRPP